MSSINALGIIGTGGLGVLVAGLFLSEAFKTGTEGLFGALLTIFVIAGAVALVLRAM